MSQSQTDRPVLILGMHRSGTSCLAGCLQSAGLVLGEVNTFASHNKKGNREHESIRDIHEGLLAHQGYAWDRPPPHQVDWRALDEQHLLQETATLRKNRQWGYKDPRTIFCLEGWNKLFSPVLIATFRHPESVARSLLTRAEAWGTEMTRAEALSLWNAYNLELLRITQAQGIPFVRYGITPDNYIASVKQAADTLRLNADRATEFYTQRLQHDTQVSDTVPTECSEIWDRLLAR